MIKVFVIALITILCAPYVVVAQDNPIPTSRTQALGDVEQKLNRKKAEAKKLQNQKKSLNKELSETQKTLVSRAAAIKDNETALIALEKRIAGNQNEMRDLVTKLDTDRASLSQMILGLERVHRVPPEALILKPGAPYETAQTALVLETVLPQIYARAEDLKAKTLRLENVLKDLKEDRNELADKQQKLEIEYTDIQNLVSKRKKIIRQTSLRYEERQAEVKSISSQAITLRDLVQKLEADKKRRATRDITKKAVYQQPKSLPKTGSGQLPISGTILTGYGRIDEIGAKAQGITIGGRSQGIVLAPMGGRVQFAGDFKNYGKIVIIEHEKNYHSLIGGLQRIDIPLEAVLNAGEPIGRLPAKQNGQNPTLYYELRHKGRPVNPAHKIANIKS